MAGEIADAKRRLVLVVQADNLQTGLPQTIVAMISSNMSRAGHPSRVTVMRVSPEGQQMGLHCDSVIMTDDLATVLDQEIDRVIGKHPNMQPVDIALRHTLGL
ncbi:MAG: type II toxin-antitoxin system PemK/MazF family toxin [Planctomycetota bacterium]|nr:type II toxin-antitoxin system PemK/MazF family toxin [Planctomycetota bacterium]